jgi:hypothetical protein
MNYSQAFSDGEIVTIAAVAAAALGGVVIGLGRGQARHANDHQHFPDPHRLSQVAKRGIERHAPSGSDVAEQLGRSARAVLDSARERLPSDRSAPDLRRLQRRVQAGSPRPSDLAGSLRDLAARVVEQLSLPETLESAPNSARDKAIRAVQRAPASSALSMRVQPFGWLAAARTLLRSRPEVHISRQDVSRPKESIQTGLEATGERLAEVPHAVAAARDRAANELHERVAQPVSRAAATTKDVTMEAFAAAAWLTAASAVVYFGLLSDERREQFKSALCGAIEQARLLALDFQGYEPEM